MRINPFLMPGLVFLALFGTVFTAQTMGQWTTSGRVAIDPGNMTAADLKGWMTLQEVMDGLKISPSALYAAGKIPADIPASTALNKLEALVPGFSVTTLRSALTAIGGASSTVATMVPSGAAATGTPFAPTAPATAATAVATSVSKESGTGTGTGPTPVPAGQVLPADQIKGKMTLQDVSTQCAVPLDALLQKLNLPVDTSADAAIKDLVTQGKLTEVTDVQKIVAEMQTR